MSQVVARGDFGLADVTGSGILAALGGILLFALFIAGIAAFVWIAIRLAPGSAYAVSTEFLTLSPLGNR